MRLSIAVLCVSTVLALAGCSSSTPSAGPSSVVTSSEPAAGPTPASWCDVQLGDAKADVIGALGEANGEAPAGFDALVWEIDQTIYLATFVDGAASNLQAYQGAIGPVGAVGLPCEAFRN